MTATRPTLADEIRAFAADLSEADPNVIGRKFLDQLDDGKARLIAEMTIGNYARTVLTTPPRLAAQPSTPPRTSTKTRLIRAYGAAQLADLLRMHVYTGGDTWKHLADCTVADLRVAAVRRYEHAAATLTEARRWETLADAVETAGCGTVAEFDGDALLEAFRR